MSKGLGTLVKGLVDKRGLSTNQMSLLMSQQGVYASPTTIWKIMNDKVDMPRADILDGLARVLGIELDALLEAAGIDRSPRWSSDVAQVADRIQALPAYWHSMAMNQVCALLDWVDTQIAETAPHPDCIQAIIKLIEEHAADEAQAQEWADEAVVLLRRVKEQSSQDATPHPLSSGTTLEKRNH
jgi:transcriptional regulator with XRE-family HTH domain